MQFPRLWTDEHILTSSSIFNQRNETISCFRGMANQEGECRLSGYGWCRANKRIPTSGGEPGLQSQQKILGVPFSLLEQLECQIRELCLQRDNSAPPSVPTSHAGRRGPERLEAPNSGPHSASGWCQALSPHAEELGHAAQQASGCVHR
jgi:hypothetical protein